MPTKNRAPIKSLKPLDLLYAFTASPLGTSAEPPRKELVADLKAGKQPYPVVVIGSTLFFGLGLIRAAEEAGVDAVETCECGGREPLNRADYGLKAAGLYLRAVLRRVQPGPFEERLIKAKVYEDWARNMQRKSPRRYADEEQKRKRGELRKALIEQEFDCAVRSLQRDVIVSHLPRELQDVVRDGRLPVRAITTTLERLPATKQKDLAARLTGGVAFAVLEEEYFGKNDKGKKTAGGKLRAIRRSITTLIEEGRELNGRPALCPEDCPDAEEAITLLSGWIAKPLQVSSLDAVVRELGEEFGRGPAGAKGAARGGRGAKGGGQ